MYGNIPEVKLEGLTGQVSGYSLTTMFLNEKGVIEAHFEKPLSGDKKITLKNWINPVDPDKVNPYPEEELEDAIKRRQTEVSITIKDIVRNYVSDEVFANATNGASSYEEFAISAIALIPANSAEIKGKLVVGYKENGYLSYPNSCKVFFKEGVYNGHLSFFTTDPKKKLMNLPKNLNLDKPEQEQVEETATTTNTKW